MNTPFRKKILHRAKYRGIKELDIILRSFVKKYINDLSNNDLNDLLNFLDNNDEDIFKFKQGIEESNIINNNVSNLFKNYII